LGNVTLIKSTVWENLHATSEQSIEANREEEILSAHNLEPFIHFITWQII
jgi:hypothetical protein